MAAVYSKRQFQSLRVVYLLLVISLFRNVHAFMDMEELKSVYYGLDILSEPVMINKDTPIGTVQVTSKYGQQYQCSFPDHTEAEKKKEEEEKVAVETGIVEMLKPMQSQDCLVKTKDWWTYEFCYGKSVRQYHMEDGAIKGIIIHLGFYESDFDWTNQTAKDERLKSSIAGYHSQAFTHGDKCDLTGRPRSVEARFMCEENSEDYLSRIEESETCVYTVTIMTSRICRHPYLKPPVRRKAVPITCNPLLSEDQFHHYMTEINERKKAAERYKMDQQKFYEKDMKADSSDLDKELEDALSATAKELLSEPAGSLFPKPDKNGVVSKESFRQMFGPSEQLWELYQKGLELNKKTMVERKKKMAELKELEKKEETEEDKEDEEVLSEFSEEIGDIKERFKKSKNKFARIKQKLADEKKWETNIENAIKEAEQELGVKLDHTLVSGLSSTLNKLVNKLQDTEAELNTMDKEINGLRSEDSETEDGITKRTDEQDEMKSDKINKDDEEDEDEKKKKGLESSVMKGEEVDEKQMGNWHGKEGEDLQDESRPPGPYEDKIKSPPRTDQQSLDYSDQKLEVPSTFPLPKDPTEDSPDDTEAPPTDAQGEDDQDSPKIKITLNEVEENEDLTNSLPGNIKELLEESVRKEYEKKRVRKGSGKLGLDDDHSFIQDKSIHVIQQEDKEGNTNRFIFVLGFKNMDEEAEEQEKQSSLEENYGFVFKKKEGSKNIDEGGDVQNLYR